MILLEAGVVVVVFVEEKAVALQHVNDTMNSRNQVGANKVRLRIMIAMRNSCKMKRLCVDDRKDTTVLLWERSKGVGAIGRNGKMSHQNPWICSGL